MGESQVTGVAPGEPNTTQRPVGSPTSEACTAISKMTPVDPKALVQVGHKSHGKTAPVPKVDPEWRENLERLAQRKFNYGLGYKSIIHILGLCLLYISKLRHKIKRNKTNKTEHCSRLFTNRAGLVPWCLNMLCGLSEKHGCGRPHPRSAFTTEFLQANRPDFEKHNLHYRLQPVAVDSKYLGDPEGLNKAILAWKEGSLTFIQSQVLAFDYFGILWHTLAYFGILWHTLAFSGILWLTLAYSGILWH